MNNFVGQKSIIEHIELLKNNDGLPRFMIITGNKLAGKSTFARRIGEIIAKGNVICTDGKVDTIRSIIDSAYKAAEDIVYIIDDFENMSINAKNALLKATEECPRRAYFMLVGTNINSLPLTLQNRAYLLAMLPYTPQELMLYAKQAGQFKENEINLLMEICETPAEIEYFKKVNITEFYDFISTIAFKFSELTGVESFRLNHRIKLKKDSEGYDLFLVMKKVNKIILNALVDNKIDPNIGFNIVSATIASMGKLNTNSINHGMLFDNWMLSIREVCR